MQRSKKRKLQRARSIVVRAPLASAILAVLQPAQAQDQAQQQGLEELVVTATKTGEQSLQDVPLSIQAIGTEKLEEYNITKFDDYVKFLPSVSYQTFGPGFALVYMRGVASGGDGNHSGPLPSVGVYLDEQPITTITGALDLHLYDIARVESLAGPQGTLYGASSQAGTIRIITNKPDPSAFSSSYGLELNTVGEGGEGYLAEGHVNIPVGDRAAIRLVGWARKDAGYIDNVAFQRTWPACEAALSTAECTTDSAPLAEEDFNDVETYGARAALRIDLNDNWTLTPTVMGQKMYADGVFGYDVTQGELKTAHVYPDWSEDEWWSAALTVEGKIANLDVTYAGAYLDRQVDTRLDYSDYSYFYDSCCSYSVYYMTDAAGDPTIGQYIWGDDGYKKISHELRFATPGDRRVRFVGGLFYQQQTHDITQRYWIDNLNPAFWVTGWPDTVWLTQQQRVDEDRAIFGELSFDITDKLTATGGLRYYEFDNSLEGFFGYGDWGFSSNGEAECNDPVNFPNIPPGTYRGAPCKRIDKSTADEDFLGKINLSYKFTDDFMAYATWSEGYRPGGINRRGTLPPYQTDFLTNYELGWKTTLAGGRLRFNGAVFYEEWDDFQFALLGQNGLTDIKNAAGAEIKGVEMDLTWALTDTFQLSGGVAYIDSELTAPYCGFVDPATDKPVAVDPCPDLQDLDEDGDTTETFAPEAREGTTLPVTPEWKGNLTLRQEFQMGEFESYWRASYVYKGSSRADLRDAENAILGDQPSYDIIDFSLGADRGSWGLELFVNNVTDERTVLYRTVQCAESICGDEPYIYTTPPRTIGLKFTQNFGK
ncbi:MAG TPA: TonB-dependent receptor [Steroidobacteraceae bacterium]|nr:TonB-dependent receptor [Steroidobacteraceae bacterium]